MKHTLPFYERFSQNPRTLKFQHRVPALSLLGLNQSKNVAQSSRPLPSALPPLINFPQLHEYDIDIIKPLPGAPLRPSEVIEVFSHHLAAIEFGEILHYRNIWYIGQIESKPARALTDEDYNDHKKQYKALPLDQIAYRYQILSMAGGGAFSKVYRCFDHKDRKPIAIKIIRAKDDCLQYADLEAKIQADILSSHSVKIFDSFHWRGHICFSMELLCTDIYSIVEKKADQTLPLSTVRHLVYQVLQVLYELWRKKIVHADIKPENILSTDEKVSDVKLADYGTACYESKQIFSYIQSRYYRAPDVLFGFHYDSAIDMWSLGCVIYELLVGNPIFPADSEDELYQMIVGAIGEPPIEFIESSSKELGDDEGIGSSLEELLKGFDPGPSEIIRGCLVWDPEERMTPAEALQTKWMKEEYEVMKSKRRPIVPPLAPIRPFKGRWRNK